MMISQNKNVRQLVWHLYVDTVVKGNDLYCYKIESDRNSVVSQASCSMDTAGVRGRNGHRKTDYT